MTHKVVSKIVTPARRKRFNWKRFLFPMLMILGMAVPAYAQDPPSPTTDFEVEIIRRDTVTTVSTTVIPKSQFNCGLIPSTPINDLVANPNQLKLLNPEDNLECVYRDNGQGPMSTLPFGTLQYSARVRAINMAGRGEPSPMSNPFWHPGGLPATLTRVLTTKGS